MTRFFGVITAHWCQVPLANFTASSRVSSLQNPHTWSLDFGAPFGLIKVRL